MAWRALYLYAAARAKTGASKTTQLKTFSGNSGKARVLGITRQCGRPSFLDAFRT